MLWACEPGFLEQYLIKRANAGREDITAADSLFNAIPAPGSEQAVDEIYSRHGEAAHIRIEGALSPNGPDAWDRIFGIAGSSYTTITAAINRAKADPLVQSVVFHTNTPGGMLDGADAVWQAHADLAKTKPTEARIENLLASAGYWIMAPAGKILASSPTDRIGSIGIVAAVMDTTKMWEDSGIKKIQIVSKNAPKKRSEPVTKEVQNALQEQMDALERIFYARVSEGRRVSTEHIAEHFGKGGLLVAVDPSTEHDDAIRAGMIDGLEKNDSFGTAATSYMSAAAYEESVKPGAKFYSVDGKELPAEECERIRQSLINMETPPQGEAISPAPAGTKQEGHMDLSGFLKENPAAAAEIDKLKSEAKAEGRAEANAEYSARVEKILPILTSETYPSHIKSLAKDAFNGGEGMAAFRAGVSVFDAQAEKAKSDAAKAQTEEIGAVGAEAPDNRPAAEKQLDAAIHAEIERRKVK